METITFYKYQGTGNDFIMIDDRQKKFDLQAHDLIARMCDRRFGIGADGLILIRHHPEADFEMIYFNADGHQTSLCGNGSRCTVSFAQFLGIIKPRYRFMTIEGMLEAKIENELVHIKMPEVSEVDIFDDHYFLNTGSPHHICMVNDIEKYDVFHEGRKIRNGAPYFQEGTNVNFVKSLSADQIYVRTYERGVEDETLSCGTGVTASALAASLQGASSPLNIKTKGGDLQVSFEKSADNSFRNIYLIGPAKRVFEGVYEI